MTVEPTDAVSERSPVASRGDGRHRRSERNRDSIVDAMFTLIQAGKMEPSAAEVAEEAGVSARTVFRHFEDMDSLYAEMAQRMERDIFPIISQPFTEPGWRERLNDLLTRRFKIYDWIMPLKTAANIRRFGSPFLMAQYRRFLSLERELLMGVLPDTARDDEILFAALEMCAGFQTWRRLRQDQLLDADKAAAVVRLTIDRLLADT